MGPSAILLLCGLFSASLGAPASSGRPSKRAPGGPIVALPYGQFQGTSAAGVDSFLGVPFASPPTGNLRLRQPQPPKQYTGVQDASVYGPGCPTQTLTGDALAGLPVAVASLVESLPIFQAAPVMSEDCLYINVQRPANTSATAKLPVLVWIYGGGFEFGSTNMYPGNGIVTESVQTGQPLIYVSMGYRLAGFGFLPGKEVKKAGVGNLGVQDQLFALKWVNSYISRFGGDPKRVTIWGESAGSTSVSLQMITNGGKNGNPTGLFQAAVMNSGSPVSVGDIANANAQLVYDTVVKNAGCTGAKDTLQCLRGVSYATYKNASDSLPGLLDYQGLRAPYFPRVDGIFLTDNPDTLLAKGLYSKVPLIQGDCADEGTLFSLPQANVTTDQQFREFVNDVWFQPATPDEIDRIAQAYPSDPTQGSPYDTLLLNAYTPEAKRLASFQGDVMFQSPRRYFLNYTSTTQKAWVYLNRRLMATPILGSFHATDLVQYYSPSAPPTTQAQDYLINFVNTHDPNGKDTHGDLIAWPTWTKTTPTMLQYDSNGATLSLILDTYRQQPMQVLKDLFLKYPV